MRPSKLCSRELHGALADEQRRQAVDAAKKKAVAQHADYDTFKKMVSVAHLRPLQALSSHAGHKSLLPAWQLDPASLGCHQQQQEHASHNSSSSHSSANTAPVGAQALPSNSQEFAREWRRRCPTAAGKYRLLKQCGPHGLSAIFRVQIEGQLLGQVLHALRQALAEAASPAAAEAGAEQGVQEQQQQAPCESASQLVVREAVTMVQLLHSLTGTGRFGLSVALLDAGARQAAAQLCAALGQALQDGEDQQQGRAAEAGDAAAEAAAAPATMQEAARAQLQHVRSQLRV